MSASTYALIDSKVLIQKCEECIARIERIQDYDNQEMIHGHYKSLNRWYRRIFRLGRYVTLAEAKADLEQKTEYTVFSLYPSIKGDIRLSTAKMLKSLAEVCTNGVQVTVDDWELIS